MTTPNVDTRTAGRALDAEIAETVMGAEWKPNGAFAGHEWLLLGSLAVAERGHGYDRLWDTLPHYSTDIAAAWLVVEKMDDWRVVIERVPSGEFEVMFDTRRVFYNVKAATLPLAICLAALAVVAPTLPRAGRAQGGGG